MDLQQLKIEAQPFKIRFSIKTKLLLLISFLLIIPILILNITAISLFLKDKKAYIYDSQATATALAGREFVSYLDNGIGILKLMIGSANLSKPLPVNVKNTIEFYLENQHSFMGVELYAMNASNRILTLAYQQFLSNDPKEPPLLPKDVQIETTVFTQHQNDLQSPGYFFKNISKPGLPPLLAVVFADPNHVKSQGYLPIAVGYISLKHFLSGTSQSFSRLAIVNQTGAPLFYSDLKMIYAGVTFEKDAVFQQAATSAVISGAKEYVGFDGVRMLGSYYKPGLGLTAMSQISYDKAMRATYSLTEKFVTLAFASLGVMIIIGLIFAKQLTAPLNRLFHATAQIALGNFNINLPITAKDEIGALSSSFMSMSRKISELIQEMVDKIRVDQELEIAKTVQQSLLPPPLIQNEHLILSSHYQSATECGGDWWGYFKDKNKHVIAIADATGHGLSSALMTASARSCFSVLEKLISDSSIQFNPTEILHVANRVVYDSAQGKIMMTFFVCVLDFDTHTIMFANAGHNPPWLFSSKKNDEIKVTSLLSKAGQRLGENRILADSNELKSMPFEPQDTLVLYTDGLLEGKNAERMPYGKKRARKIIESTINNEPHIIVDNLITDFLNHNGGKPLDDDITLAIARML